MNPQCVECGRWFTDTSGTFIENANVDLPVWVYVIREMDKGRSIHWIDLPSRLEAVDSMVPLFGAILIGGASHSIGILPKIGDSRGTGVETGPNLDFIPEHDGTCEHRKDTAQRFSDGFSLCRNAHSC